MCLLLRSSGSGPVTHTVTLGLWHLSRPLQTLATERAGMEEALRELKAKDNVLPRILATPPQVSRVRGSRRLDTWP